MHLGDRDAGQSRHFVHYILGDEGAQVVDQNLGKAVTETNAQEAPTLYQAFPIVVNMGEQKEAAGALAKGSWAVSYRVFLLCTDWPSQAGLDAHRTGAGYAAYGEMKRHPQVQRADYRALPLTHDELGTLVHNYRVHLLYTINDTDQFSVIFDIIRQLVTRVLGAGVEVYFDDSVQSPARGSFVLVTTQVGAMQGWLAASAGVPDFTLRQAYLVEPDVRGKERR